MREEISAAVKWWCQNTRFEAEQEEAGKIDVFKNELERLITEVCDGHWYPHDPLMGSGYRSLMNDIRVDAKLIAAGEKAGIPDIAERVPLNMVMWINPGASWSWKGSSGSASIASRTRTRTSRRFATT